MINPFEASGDIQHIPINISAAFENIGESSISTESLLASKSKMMTSFNTTQSEKKFSSSSLKLSESKPETSLSVADLTASDTFCMSKSSSSNKQSKPPLSSKLPDKKSHCETCKCLQAAPTTFQMVESQSLQYLSKLESLPMPMNPYKSKASKPYMSPIYRPPTSPSQVFRQRINSHILHATPLQTKSHKNIFSLNPI
jgi:hypothetical protein